MRRRDAETPTPISNPLASRASRFHWIEPSRSPAGPLDPADRLRERLARGRGARHSGSMLEPPRRLEDRVRRWIICAWRFTGGRFPPSSRRGEVVGREMTQEVERPRARKVVRSGSHDGEEHSAQVGLAAVDRHGVPYPHAAEDVCHGCGSRRLPALRTARQELDSRVWLVQRPVGVLVEQRIDGSAQGRDVRKRPALTQNLERERRPS